MCDGELTRGPLKERIWGELKHCSLLCVDIPGRNLSDLGPPTTLRTEWTPSRRVDPPFAPEAAAVRAGSAAAVMEGSKVNETKRNVNETVLLED